MQLSWATHQVWVLYHFLWAGSQAGNFPLCMWRQLPRHLLVPLMDGSRSLNNLSCSWWGRLSVPYLEIQEKPELDLYSGVTTTKLKPLQVPSLNIHWCLNTHKCCLHTHSVITCLGPNKFSEIELCVQPCSKDLISFLAHLAMSKYWKPISLRKHFRERWCTQLCYTAFFSVLISVGKQWNKWI